MALSTFVVLSALGLHVVHVVCLRSEKQMGRIHAIRNVAGMADLQRSYRPNKQLESPSVSFLSALGILPFAVTIAVERPGP